jgi:ATP-dependent RNA helicase DeaD
VAITLAEPREHRVLKAFKAGEEAADQSRRCPRLPIYAHDASSWPAPRWRKGLTDELERFRVVVETLADDFDVMQVELAAAKLAPTRSTTRCDGRHGEPSFNV